MIDNVSKIGHLLSFEDSDDFYFLEIIKRKKDNPAMEKNAITIDYFYIDSHEDFYKKITHIINLCNHENARAYIRLNKRNYKKLGPHFLKKVVDIVFTDNCKALRESFMSVVEEHHSDPDKKWVIDVDKDKNIPFGDLSATLNQLQREAKKEPMLVYLDTKNGYHYITRPFNLQNFKFRFPMIDVHKDNPTVLYAP